MPTQVTILVRGLALCFYRDRVWNVVFVCDEFHPVKVEYNDAGGTRTAELREAGRDLDATLAAEEIAEVGEPFGQDSERVFNMAAEYAHHEAKLVIRRRKDKTDLVWLKLPSATLSASAFTEREYYVQEMLDYPGSPVEIIPPVATELKFSFTVKDELSLELTDPRDANYTKSIRPAVDGNAIVIKLNNDCEDRCTHNDFLDLYELLFEDPTDRQFAAGQIKKSSLAEVQMYSAQHGNCDPVVVEPPPG